MYQANNKTIIRHAKNLNIISSYLEEAEKEVRSQNYSTYRLNDCKIMTEQETDTVHYPDNI